MADSIGVRKVIRVKHLQINSTKTVAEVERALASILPPLPSALLDALSCGDEERAKELSQNSDLYIFSKRDHGAILRGAGQSRSAFQYEIGNPLTAIKMTRHNISAALYAPLRVLLHENSNGGSIFEYDLPSSLFGQFGDERITAVAQDLDATLGRALACAAQ
jgi:uncharacterized protein (DUF302 family)